MRKKDFSCVENQNNHPETIRLGPRRDNNCTKDLGHASPKAIWSNTSEIYDSSLLKPATGEAKCP